MKLTELSLEGFCRELASGTPTPGGGSAAALAGALSASLAAMVARLTLGSERYREAWKSMEAVRDLAESIKETLLNLVDRDAEAYDGVLAAMRLPRATGVEQEARFLAIEEAVRRAAAVPLAVLETLSRMPDLLRTALERGNPNCLSDVGVAIQLLQASAAGAAYNVGINLGCFRDRGVAAEFSARARELLAQVENASIALKRDMEPRLPW